MTSAVGLAEGQHFRLPAAQTRTAAPRPWRRRIRGAVRVVAAFLVLSITAMFVLLAIMPRSGLYATYTVMTESMEPNIPMGSVVVAVPETPSELRVGDVISVTSMEPPYTTITHRIAQIVPTAQGPEFKTRGDANLLEDPWQFAFTGPAGKVILAIPLLGYILVYSATIWGRLTLAGLVGLLVAVYFLSAIWRPKPKPLSSAPAGLPVAMPAPSVERRKRSSAGQALGDVLRGRVPARKLILVLLSLGTMAVLIGLSGRFVSRSRSADDLV